MRIVHFAAAGAFATLAGQPAFACKPFGPGFDQPAPVAFWSEPPPASQLKPGEVVLRVSFSRLETDEDPDQIDYQPHPASGEDIVIITCFANPVFKVVEVLAGSAPDTPAVMLYGHGLNYHSSAEQILVGRLLPLKKTTRNGSAPAPDSPSAMLIARLPAQ